MAQAHTGRSPWVITRHLMTGKAVKLATAGQQSNSSSR